MTSLLGKVTRNPYVGIKVPWTLRSDKVWNATHRLGAWLFTGCGILGAVLVAVHVPIATTIIPILVAAVVPIIYSYFLSRRLASAGEL